MQTMKQERGIPRPGEFYRHFKNKLYQIVAVAVHSETGEPMVVYQALYGDFRVWVRPLPMFLEAVDRAKYPEAEQEYRFERVELQENRAENGEAASAVPTGCEPVPEGCEPQMNPYLLDFFDAMDTDNYDKMLECLNKMAGRVTQKELDDIYMVLDVQPAAGYEDPAEQIAFLKRHLLMLRKFDGERLR